MLSAASNSKQNRIESVTSRSDARESSDRIRACARVCAEAGLSRTKSRKSCVVARPRDSTPIVSRTRRRSSNVGPAALRSESSRGYDAASPPTTDRHSANELAQRYRSSGSNGRHAHRSNE